MVFFEVKWSSKQHYTYMYKAFLLWHASPGMDMDEVVAWRISLNPIPKWNCFFTITNWQGNELDLFAHFILFISASLPPCEANGANMGYKGSYLALKSRCLVSFFLFSRYLNSSNSFIRYLTTIIQLFSNPIPPSARTPVDKLVKANNKLLCHSPGWGCIESVPSLERMQLLSIFPDCSFLCSMVFCVLHTWSWYDFH